MDAISEELLSAWLRLSNVINNQRLVEGQSFNQAQVCGLLARAQEKGRSLTGMTRCSWASPYGGEWSPGWWIPSWTAEAFREKQ